jgi:hypothetical protein
VLSARALENGGLVVAVPNYGMFVRRIGVEEIYTFGDRFVHDPALAPPSWPTLEPLRKLAAMPDGSHAADLPAVSATRVRNLGTIFGGPGAGRGRRLPVRSVHAGDGRMRRPQRNAGGPARGTP